MTATGPTRYRNETVVVGQTPLNQYGIGFLRYKKGSKGEEAARPYTYKPAPTPVPLFPKKVTTINDRTVSVPGKGSLKIPAGTTIEITGFDMDADGGFYKGTYLGTEFRVVQKEVKEPLHK